MVQRAASDEAISDCARCPVGGAAGVERGYRCPMSPRPRPGGQLLYVADEGAKAVWLVKRGSVLLSETDERGRERLAGVRGCGQLVGVEALVRGRYAHTARTGREATLCAAPLEAFSRWLDGEGAARTALTLVLLAQEVDRTGLRSGSALARTARWLLRQRTEATALQRQHVAQLLGMAPETFSRMLAQLRALGVVRVSRSDVRVLDARALERLAREDLDADPAGAEP